MTASVKLKPGLLACLTVALLASVMATHGQIVMTAAMTAPGTNSATAPTLATSASFNLSGGNAVALLVTSENSSTTTGLGASFAGQPMTLRISTNQANQWSGIFYLIYPTIKSGTFEITGSVDSTGLAYSAIALKNVDSVADAGAKANTLTSGNTVLPYTTSANGGFLLGAAVNNGYNTSTAPPPAFFFGNADQMLYGPAIIPSGSSGHLHVYGDVSTTGSDIEVFANQANGTQRNAYAILAFETDTPGMATRELRTAGQPAKVVLRTERSHLAPDWEEVAYVEATVVDEHGVRVPNASHLVHFDVAGPGLIAAVDSGSIVSHEPFQGSQRQAFQGRCFAIIRATAPRGSITLKAVADGLEGEEVEIPVISD